ncbi:Lrp/AsnC ligand binding domain-containing protein [Actinomadura barringtoniae]|uniref:Lrp/AsnC ligand binding domain-containing protein n=1 Tax=Actinomadura barringtoniae TaxID=1427535 RepID=A0A939PK89_9ACTN|nr:Lrp/AsnC ligand binding domain-containing protein [Actinomadura barringtoniae]MBO2450106.1 Lrp/AsnC ligand binding domain-containing protein [Actinomadura barringtoniae]
MCLDVAEHGGRDRVAFGVVGVEQVLGCPAVAAATTGTTNLYATVVCASQRDLYQYLTTRVAKLPAITHVETAPVIRTLKQAANQT